MSNKQLEGNVSTFDITLQIDVSMQTGKRIIDEKIQSEYAVDWCDFRGNNRLVRIATTSPIEEIESQIGIIGNVSEYRGGQ